MPDAVPGAAVSPGIRICSFANAPALTVVAGLVFAVIAPFVTSVAVNVGDDAVFGVTEKVLVPATSAAFAGSAAFGSVDVIPTVSVDETGFQFASTALTVTLNAEPAVCADGLPVLPEAVPGAAVSPGNRSCSFANAPATIVMDALEAESASTSPAVRWATSVSAPAFVYCTVESVCVFVPATIVPVLLEMVPAPDGLRVTEVVAATFDRLPYASSETNVTEKFVPAVTLPAGTVVTSSFDAAAALAATVRRSEPAELIVPSVTVIAGDSAL